MPYRMQRCLLVWYPHFQSIFKSGGLGEGTDSPASSECLHRACSVPLTVWLLRRDESVTPCSVGHCTCSQPVRCSQSCSNSHYTTRLALHRWIWRAEKPGVFILSLVSFTTHSGNAFTPSLGKVTNTHNHMPLPLFKRELCFQLGFGIWCQTWTQLWGAFIGRG